MQIGRFADSSIKSINMKAKITRVEVGRSEVTILLLDAPYQLPVTVDVNGIRIVEKSKGDD